VIEEGETLFLREGNSGYEFQGREEVVGGDSPFTL
jgi:hypothetical protein